METGLKILTKFAALKIQPQTYQFQFQALENQVNSCCDIKSIPWVHSSLCSAILRLDVIFVMLECCRVHAESGQQNFDDFSMT